VLVPFGGDENESSFEGILGISWGIGVGSDIIKAEGEAVKNEGVLGPKRR